MTDADLDRSYTALCHALADVGEARSELFLSMLSLALLARCPDADAALEVIARVRRRCAEEVQDGPK